MSIIFYIFLQPKGADRKLKVEKQKHENLPKEEMVSNANCQNLRFSSLSIIVPEALKTEEGKVYGLGNLILNQLFVAKGCMYRS